MMMATCCGTLAGREVLIERRIQRVGAAFDKAEGPRFLARMATTPLTQNEITAALRELPGWTFERDALAHTFQFGSFREAMSFMVRVGFEAEAADHHPEWTNVYNKVAIRLNTHDAGNKVTAKDVALAKKIAGLSWVR
jgi:4a-hydroxytetrahydrobiopterin dehydratase